VPLPKTPLPLSPPHPLSTHSLLLYITRKDTSTSFAYPNKAGEDLYLDFRLFGGATWSPT
jgi:hypothetical protein